MRKGVCMNQDAGLDGSDKPGTHMRMWFLFFEQEYLLNYVTGLFILFAQLREIP
jgi:hypothetical protein